MTETVAKVSQSVDALTKEGERMFGKLKDHDDRISDIGSTIREQAVRLNFTWVLVAMVIAALIGGAISWMMRTTTTPTPQVATPTSNQSR